MNIEPFITLALIVRRGLLLALSGSPPGLAITLAATLQIALALCRVNPTEPVSIAGAAHFLIVVDVAREPDPGVANDQS